jgi:oligopeptide/dipeptide ABC transporter ATP-binding protein
MPTIRQERATIVKPFLEIQDLKVHFPIKKGVFSQTVGYVYAVDGVSFKLEKGNTLGIVGESGCGKTTTGMAILRLIEATGGSVLFNGQDVTKFDRSRLRSMRKEMQLIFQDPYSSLNPRMTVNQILEHPLKIHKLYGFRQRKERVAYLLEKVGLSAEQGRRYPHEFSGGQRQRIGIARALALNPMLIIGDEPVSALDVSIQAQIINLLISLQQEFNLSYIIISHDLAMVEFMCDHIAVMYLGKIVEFASYEQLYVNPRHPYTKALLSAIPVPEPRRKKERILLGGDVPSPMNPPSGCHFHPRCAIAEAECSRLTPSSKWIEPGHLVTCHRHEFL